MFLKLLFVWASCKSLLAEGFDSQDFSGGISSDIAHIPVKKHLQKYKIEPLKNVYILNQARNNREKRFEASAKILQSPLTYPRSIKKPPIHFDIRTVHDNHYKVHDSKENDSSEKILPKRYTRKVDVENVKPITYVSDGLTNLRVRRYTREKKNKSVKNKKPEENEDSYDFRADYTSMPKEFDSEIYSSPYKEGKDEEKDESEEDDYDGYDYDSGYDNKEYERIKELSEKQAAEVKQNPENCKEVIQNGMKCAICKDPKTGGNYESCAYADEPTNNKYAYSKDNRFDSKDAPDDSQSDEKEGSPSKSERYQAEKKESSRNNRERKSRRKHHDDDGDENNSSPYHKAYYKHSVRPKHSEKLRVKDESGSNEKGDPNNQYEKLNDFYGDTEPKKDVEHVLEEFKKKDRTSCKKVIRNGMTCYQCIDKSGQKNEECMYVSESAPKRSHVAYQEVKEFTSKPATLNGPDNIAHTTFAPIVATFGKKIKNKKPAKLVQNKEIEHTTRSQVHHQRTARSKKPNGRKNINRTNEAQKEEQSNIAPPEDFASSNSRGAFWAETEPQYSQTLGVSLPQFMLAPSEHEASFDETVAGS